MTALTMKLTFPTSPITSLQKRLDKAAEDLYYAKLYLTSPAYAGPEIWRAWLGLGFHVAIKSAPTGTKPADVIRVRVKGPSPTPVMTVTAGNADALKELESLLRLVDGVRPSVEGKGEQARAAALRQGELARVLVDPLILALQGYGFESGQVDQYLGMLQRDFDALTHDELMGMELSLS